MVNSDTRKSAFLGMSYGTAKNQLRKLLLFDMVSRAGMDRCYSCGFLIENARTLSVEHIKPWLGKNRSLFWDLDNISFSYLSCNIPHVYRGSAQGDVSESDFLGLSISSAYAVLRKSILFNLAGYLDMSNCVRCGLSIGDVKVFSLEHIVPWEGRDLALFWDLGNIGFSHVRCNVPHRYNTLGKIRKIAPEGTAWCWCCKSFLSVSDFYICPSAWNGVRSRCKVCTKATTLSPSKRR